MAELITLLPAHAQDKHPNLVSGFSPVLSNHLVHVSPHTHRLQSHSPQCELSTEQCQCGGDGALPLDTTQSEEEDSRSE